MSDSIREEISESFPSAVRSMIFPVWVCMAKTQYSLTDDATKLGAPTDFDVTVRNLKISAGAGFIVALTGDIMTMPGLPKVPAAERIDVDAEGKITGLF